MGSLKEGQAKRVYDCVAGRCTRRYRAAGFNVLVVGLTLKHHRRALKSSPYIPAIANAFFRAGEIEAWGRGVERIFAACEVAGTPKPVLRYESSGMCLEFAFDVAYLKALGTGRQTPEQSTPQVAEQVTRLIFALGDQALSLQEIMQALGLSHRPHFLALHLRPALGARLVQMTVPDKPNSRLQRYKLTASGRLWLEKNKT